MERSIVIARSIGQVWQEAVPRRMVVLAFVEPEDIREAKRQSVAESRQRKAALQKQHVVPEPGLSRSGLTPARRLMAMTLTATTARSG